MCVVKVGLRNVFGSKSRLQELRLRQLTYILQNILPLELETITTSEEREF